MTPDPALPWRSERPLDARLVERLVELAFPDLEPAVAVYLDEGWDSEVYLVNDTWIVRFPKRADTAMAPRIDQRVLPWIAGRVHVPVPRPELFGELPELFPFPFGGYRRLEGTSLDALGPGTVDVARIAGELAGLLADLRAIDPVEARAHGVVASRPLLAGDARDREDRRWAVLRPLVDGGLAHRVEAALRIEVPTDGGALAVCHGDLRDAHVLLDPSGSRVVGVLDWTDVQWGDPARDVAGLVAAFGAGPTRRALQVAGIPLDERDLARARRRAVHVSLAVAWHGALAERPRDLACGLAGLDRATGP